MFLLNSCREVYWLKKTPLTSSKASERPRWEGIEPVQGRALETERKHLTHEVVVVGVDHHLDLISSEMLDMVGYSGVTIRLGITNFFGNRWDVISSERGESKIRRMEDLGPLWDCGVSSWIRFRIISTRSSMRGVGRPGGLALIGAFLVVWGRELAMSSTAPAQAVSVARGREG